MDLKDLEQLREEANKVQQLRKANDAMLREQNSEANKRNNDRKREELRAEGRTLNEIQAVRNATPV